MTQEVKKLFEELVENQEKRLYKLGLEIRPNLTLDDLLQPNDYPELENHPEFRYEEGVLEGLKTSYMAYLALQRDKSFSL